MARENKVLSEARLIELAARRDERGGLVAVDHDALPFTPVRGFYVFDVGSGKERGGHAHHVTQQAVIAINGSFSIDLTDGRDKLRFRLQSRGQALYIPPLIWDRLYDFSKDAVCLVFASTPYQPSDYIRDWDAFLAERARLGAR